MPTLDIYRNGRLLRQQVLPSIDVLVLGRAPSCDVVLSDRERKVSRSHCALVHLQQPAAGFFVRDLGSLHGTRVNGASISQRLLKDDDIIEIADYRLVFSSRSSTAANFRHLKLVSSRHSSGGKPSGPLSSKTVKVLKGLSLDPQKQELLEEMHRRIIADETLPDVADDLMMAILRVLSAEKGFIGMLVEDEPTTHSECGIVNLSPEETIEISTVDFRDHLARGEALQEGSTLLVPIGRPRDVKAFFCVAKGRHSNPFDEKDIDFLGTLGRLLMPRPVEVPKQPKSRPRPNQIFPWPVGIVGRSAEIKDLLGNIRHAALSELNVMVLGESGSGKELVAQAIHQYSRNAAGPLIARNCSQLTETLSEAEIFGYEPLSGISGANPRGAAGWFELAHGGTLFLDEVHSMPPALQDKFLRVLQDKQVWKIGAKSPIHVRVKVVAATDEDPEKAVKNGLFRAPFLYRFGATIQVPPLRARADDVPLLAFYFLDKYAGATGSRTRSISHRAIRLLTDSVWTGNVRQLEQQIQLAVARDREVLFSWDFATLSHTPARKSDDRSSGPGLPEPQAMASDVPRTMDEVEKNYIKEVLEVTKGNLTKSARLLGYKSRQTLLNKMDRYRIPRNYSVRPK